MLYGLSVLMDRGGVGFVHGLVWIDLGCFRLSTDLHGCARILFGLFHTKSMGR
jgi:hypothetical protein